MALIGHAQVSTDEQTVRSRIHEEHASGGSRARPVLAQVLRQMQAGDDDVVVRLDRLARSLSHLLEVLEELEGKGAHFRSLKIRSTRPVSRASSRSSCWGRPTQRPAHPARDRCRLSSATRPLRTGRAAFRR